MGWVDGPARLPVHGGRGVAEAAGAMQKRLHGPVHLLVTNPPKPSRGLAKIRGKNIDIHTYQETGTGTWQACGGPAAETDP